MKIKQTIVLGLAGCLLFSSTALATPQTGMINNSNTAVIEKINNTILEEKIQVKNDLVEIDITIPVIEGLTDTNFEEQLNKQIKLTAQNATAELEKGAQEYAESAKENNWEIRPYQLFIDYDLKANNEDVLSFTITNYTYTGGANGMTEVAYYNIDKKANKAISLQDLFVDGSDYKEFINKEIVKQIELRSKDGAEFFFEGDMGFQTITDTQGFYLEDENIVIAFGKYEIAPGAMGIPEFAISLDSLKNILKDNYDSNILPNSLFVKSKMLNIDNIEMLPLRVAAVEAGYAVKWDGDNQSIVLTKDNLSASLKIGENVYVANHKIPYILEAAPVIINDVTYVPTSFIEKVLQYKLG